MRKLKFTKEITKEIITTLNGIQDKEVFNSTVDILSAKHNLKASSIKFTIKNAKYELGLKGLSKSSQATIDTVKELTEQGFKFNL